MSLVARSPLPHRRQTGIERVDLEEANLLIDELALDHRTFLSFLRHF